MSWETLFIPLKKTHHVLFTLPSIFALNMNCFTEKIKKMDEREVEKEGAGVCVDGRSGEGRDINGYLGQM